MIVGIGTDLIETERVLRACEKEAFLKKIFTPEEQILIAANKKRAAGNFAVKEAVSKVFGTGFGKVRPIDIEVLRDKKGKPYVNLFGNALLIARQSGILHIHVSITDTREYTQAVAVGETQL